MKVTKFIIVPTVIAFLFALPLAADKADVVTTAHNVGGAGCKSCHASHNGSVANGGTSQTTGQILLWSRGFTTQTFGTYTSPTVGNVSTEIGTTTPAASDARLYSYLCMSCHDGVTSASLISATSSRAVGNPTNSFGLRNDHPINMNQDPANDTGLKTVALVTGGGLKLYGASNTVQCASCHDAHSNTNGSFLRKTNTASALCLTCHI